MRAMQPSNDHIFQPATDPTDIARAKVQKSRKSRRTPAKRVSRAVRRFMKANPEFVFAFDVLKKVLVCSVIALSASGLHALVALLERHGIPTAVTLPLTLVEFLVFIVDVLWVTRVLVSEVFESFRTLLREAPIAKTSLALTLLLLAVAATTNAAHLGRADLRPPAGGGAAAAASAGPPGGKVSMVAPTCRMTGPRKARRSGLVGSTGRTHGHGRVARSAVERGAVPAQADAVRGPAVP